MRCCFICIPKLESLGTIAYGKLQISRYNGVVCGGWCAASVCGVRYPASGVRYPAFGARYPASGIVMQTIV